MFYINVTTATYDCTCFMGFYSCFQLICLSHYLTFLVTVFFQLINSYLSSYPSSCSDSISGVKWSCKVPDKLNYNQQGSEETEVVSSHHDFIDLIHGFFSYPAGRIHWNNVSLWLWHYSYFNSAFGANCVSSEW